MMADPTTPDEAEDDVKRKFREALERKNAARHEGSSHADGDSAIHETHTKSGGEKSFRRKAGG
jgi:hypothetical protein